jgi:hypothetical protein
MSFFDKIIAKVFGSHQVGSNIPMIQEEIKRSESFKNAYFKWLNEGKYRWLLQKIYQGYEAKKRNEPDDLQIHLLKSTGANGFAVSFSLLMEEKDLQFLMDYLKERVLELGYKSYTSDRRIFDRKEYVETIEKHYLKPITEKVNPEMAHYHPNNKEIYNQKYGNIIIEYITIDDKPSFLRFMQNYYADFLYTPALPFDDLVSNLLLYRH